jgi:tRNA-specific 2-thiouridylase
MNLPDLGLPGDPAGHRVVVAMSGGVDSSVTAALLVEHGFEVVGITLQLYDHGAAPGRAGACCAGQDIYDAARVAERLGIAHYVLDYESRFRAAVIDDFVDSYCRGETPVPCIRCNQRIKFRDLLQVAHDLGAAALATGHYVRRVVGPDGPELHRARDAARDQSYFLFATTRQELEFLRFPLGDLTKDETRDAARHFGLPIADKPDSQDICFVSNGSYARVVERLRPNAFAFDQGDIVDESGRVLGRHNGVVHFTVGQRKGLGIAAGEPLYVLKIEPERRRVVVGPRAALAETRVLLGEPNWLAEPAAGMAVGAKLRSTQPPVPARVYSGLQEGEAELVLDAAAGAVAPGQAAVLYARERVLGGGWIRRRSAVGLTQPRPFPISGASWRDSSAG